MSRKALTDTCHLQSTMQGLMPQILHVLQYTRSHTTHYEQAAQLAGLEVRCQNWHQQDDRRQQPPPADIVLLLARCCSHMKPHISSSWSSSLRLRRHGQLSGRQTQLWLCRPRSTLPNTTSPSQHVRATLPQRRAKSAQSPSCFFPLPTASMVSDHSIGKGST